MSGSRCPKCGIALRPNPLAWLGVPIVLGALAYAAMRLFGEQLGFGGMVLVATLPFAGFLLVLRQVTIAWSEVDETKCRGCGAELGGGE